MSRRGLRQALLATGSALAITIALEGAAAAQCASQNATSDVTNNAASDCITFFDQTNHNVNVTNNSTLTATGTYSPSNPGTATGISVVKSGTTLSGNIVNSASGVITAQHAGINIGEGATNGSNQNAGVVLNGSITNSGLINSGDGIFVTGNSSPLLSTVTGSIINAAGGQINDHDAGINVGFATVGGSITNAGTISGGGVGINFTFSDLGSTGTPGSGNIVNATGAKIASTFIGIIVNGNTKTAGSGTTIAGSLINDGTITVPNQSSHAGLEVASATVLGGVTNTGTINGGAGIIVFGATDAGGPARIASIAGNIVNQGQINAVSTSKSAGGIEIFGFTGGGPAIVGGSIVNSGAISVTGTSGTNDGILLTGARLAAGITNSNTISVSGAPANVGIAVVKSSGANFSPANSSIGGSILNQGTITAGTGILVSGGSTVTGGISNSGNLSGSTAAIDVTGEGAATTITQAGGTITGQILLSSLGDTVNITGGAINGNVVGSGSSGTVDFALGSGGTFTYGSSFGFSGVNQVSFNSGTAILAGSNSAVAAAIASGATLQLGAGGATGTLTLSSGILTDNGTFAIDQSNTLTLATMVTGSGSLVQLGSGTTVLSGANNYSGGTTIDQGTLQVTNSTPGTSSSIGTGTLTFNGGTLQAGTNNLTFSNAVVINTTGGAVDTQSNTLTLSGTIGNGNGAGALTKIGSGTLILTGTDTYTGGTTISSGTLQLGNGGTTGSIVGNVTDNAALAFNLSGNTTFAGAISGGGTVTQAGSGTLVLSGASNYAGATNVSAGVLDVTGSLGGTAVTVGSGATLEGTGSIAGAVTLNSGGTLMPGSGAPGTITVGPITINAGTRLAYQLGTPNVAGGATNDLTTVNGNLTINGGTLNVTNSASFGPGVYEIIDYSGTLGGTGSLAVGTLPNGDIGVIQTVVPGEVNLVVSGATALTQFWDGTTTTGDGTIHGGSGNWNTTNTNWTSANGTINSTWQNGFAVFAGTAGTVSVAAAIAYQGLQFTTSGYVLNASGGGTLNPTGLATIVVGSGLTDTIAAPIVGPGGVQTTGAGTLILTGTDTYTGGTTISAGTLQLGNGGTAGSIVGNVTDNGTLAFDLSSNTTFAGAISGSGALTQIGSGTTILTGTNTYSGGTTISAGTLQLGNGGTTGAIAGNVTDNGTLAFDLSSTTTFAGVISGAGALQQIGSGTTVLTGTNTYTGGTTITAGTLQLGNGGTSGSIVGNVTDNGVLASDLSSTVTYGGVISGTGSAQQIGSGTLILTGANTYTGGTTISAGTLQIGNGGTSGSIVGNVTDNATLAFDLSSATTFAGVISGSGVLQQNGSGSLTLTGTNTYSGGTGLNDGTVVVGNNSAFGTGTVAMAAGTTLSFLGGGNFTIANKITIAGDPNFTPPAGTTQTISGVIADGATPGTLNVNGAGTLVLSANNTYTGPTNVTSGTLDVTGSIASSSLTTVSSGAALTGNGTIGNLQIAGTFAPGSGTPGTPTAITGNLAFASGAVYLVQVNPATASSTNVSGTASLAGSVNAVFATGTYISKVYTILTAGSVSGKFSSLSNTNLPSNFTASLAYDAAHAFLDLTLNFTPPTAPAFAPLNVNETNVANTLIDFFNATGSIPTKFGTLTSSGLMQVDGEDATGAEHAALDLTNEFLSLMLDPFVYGRGGPASGGGALGFAPDQPESFPPDIALAYAGLLKAPPKPQVFDQRWTVWGAGYGGSATFDGNAAIGSTNVTASTYGFAAGADYHAAPDLVLGFALAGAGTNWDLTQGLGTGRSDAFQAGVYGTKYFGPAYLGAAFAFTNNWFTTNRTALGDQLTASFQGQSYGVRVEGGYRYALAPAAGVTPYAAIQAQNFHTPAYSETDLTGGGFGLSYNSQNATDTRSELGARFDDLTTWNAMPVQLRARIAWAHDWVSDPALSAVFQALPGTSFVVNGAPVPHDSALTTVGAELHLTPQWTLIGKFDGEFASSAQTYAGSGTLRYQW